MPDRRYALVNGEGRTVNVVLWDGKTPYTPPLGMQLVPEKKAGPYAPAIPEAEASPDIFSRLTADERAAVMTALVAMGALTEQRRDEILKP